MGCLSLPQCIRGRNFVTTKIQQIDNVERRGAASSLYISLSNKSIMEIFDVLKELENEWNIALRSHFPRIVEEEW